MPKPVISKIELSYFPRPRVRGRQPDGLLEVVFFRAQPADPRTSGEGEIVALFVYAGDAVDYAVKRRAIVQTFISAEGEIEAVLTEAGVAIPEDGVIRSEIEPGRASARPLWGIVVRPSKTRLEK